MNFDSIYFQCYSHESMAQTDGETKNTDVYVWSSWYEEAVVVNACDTTTVVINIQIF